MTRRVLYRVLFVWPTVPGEQQITQVAAETSDEARRLFMLGHKGASIVDVVPWDIVDHGGPLL